MAAALDRDYLVNRPKSDDVLLLLTVLVLIGGSILGVMVGIHTHLAATKPPLPPNAISWKKTLQGFSAFFAMVPIAILLIDTRIRTRHARTMKFSKCESNPKQCPSETKCDETTNVYVLTTGAAFLSAVALVLLAVTLRDHDVNGASASRPRIHRR
jgi:hypothetical protein